MSHTPTPWTLAECSDECSMSYEILNATGDFVIADTRSVPNGPKEEAANAAFIVKACNAHDELVAALKGCLDALVSATEEDADYVEAMIRRSNAALDKAGAL